MRVGAVVFDIDGVLVDVSDSYRRAIVDTVQQLYGEEVPDDLIQVLKNAGGFNNDWVVTDACALYVLARRAGFSLDVGAFGDTIAERGGGLAAARAVIAEALGENAQAVEAEWEPERIRSVFQQLYLGSNLYRELEEAPPDLATNGYINNEPVILQSATADELTSRFAIGVFTGRPAAEAAIALDRVGLPVPPEYRVTMDDEVPGKPDPTGLIRLARRLEVDSAVFVGDTLDDIRTATNATQTDSTRTYHSVGVLTGGLTGEAGRNQYAEAGADAVINSINDLPTILRSD